MLEKSRGNALLQLLLELSQAAWNQTWHAEPFRQHTFNNLLSVSLPLILAAAGITLADMPGRWKRLSTKCVSSVALALVNARTQGRLWTGASRRAPRSVCVLERSRWQRANLMLEAPARRKKTLAAVYLASEISACGNSVDRGRSHVETVHAPVNRRTMYERVLTPRLL